MILQNIYEAKFSERLNRFVGKGYLNWNEVLFHIGDTGRLKELLVNGNDILLQKIDGSVRKYKYRLIGVRNIVGHWILLNSLLHSKLIEEYLVEKNISYKKEVKVGDSRIDFVLLDKNKEIFVEVKGCSLMEKVDDFDKSKLFIADKFGNSDYVGLFPDAPTQRGLKHLKELIKLLESGKQAEIWFLMMNEVKYFSINTKTQPQFEAVFYNFLKKGGKVRFLNVNFKYFKSRKLVITEIDPGSKGLQGLKL